MSFVDKVKKKRVERFFEDIEKTLEGWVAMVSHSAAVASAEVNYRLALRGMNDAINYLRESLHTLRLEYNELIDEQNIDPLAISPLTEFPELVRRVEESLAKARSIAYSYNETLKQCDSQKVDTSKYLTVKNRQAIDRLFDMKVEDLLALFKDNYLLGF